MARKKKVKADPPAPAVRSTADWGLNVAIINAACNRMCWNERAQCANELRLAGFGEAADHLMVRPLGPPADPLLGQLADGIAAAAKAAGKGRYGEGDGAAAAREVVAEALSDVAGVFRAG